MSAVLNGLAAVHRTTGHGATVPEIQTVLGFSGEHDLGVGDIALELDRAVTAGVVTSLDRTRDGWAVNLPIRSS